MRRVDPLPSVEHRRVGAVDVGASLLARLLPRALEPRIDQLRHDVSSVVDGFAGRRPLPFSGPANPVRVPPPLSSIDPVERLLPRGVARRWISLRRDVGWVVRDLRGERRPFLHERRPRPKLAPAPVDRAIRPRTLEVRALRRETAAALTVELAKPSGEPLRFEAGQFLTLEVEVGGQRLRRAYSLSSSALDGPTATITVKRVEGGRVSNWINDELRGGDILRVLGPSGNFLAPTEAHHLVMIAGGSGITPIISIAETTLRSRPEARVRLLYGNRSEADVIFLDRLRALEAELSPRLEVRHALEHPAEGLSGIEGRLDAPGLVRGLEGWLGEADAHFLCGPAPMMDAARALLLERGVPSERIFEERFSSPADLSESAGLPTEPVSLAVSFGGQTHELEVAPGETLLEAGLAAGVPMPFSCAMGGCGACKVKLLEGEVHMEEPHCLSAEERNEGAVLACISRPRGSVRVEVAQ